MKYRNIYINAFADKLHYMFDNIFSLNYNFIYNILRKSSMIIKDLFQNNGFNNITAYSGKDIDDELINRCLKLDGVFYDDQFLWKDFNIADTIKQYSQMCFILVNDEKNTIVGYSYWFPIKSEILNQYIKEKKILLNIEPQFCTGYNVPNINLHCAGEAFVPGYDLLNLHKVLEDLFQYHILCLAQKGTKVSTLSVDSVCAYDEQYLVKRSGLKYCEEKNDCKFFYDKYDPRLIFSESIYCQELLKYY